MTGRRFSDARQLLGDLLTRHEANPTSGRLLAYIDEGAFLSVADQDLFEAALADMAGRGAVELLYRQIDGIRRLTSVRLKEAPAAYAWLGRTPSGETARAALADLLGPEQENLRSIMDEVQAGWSRNVRVFGLRPGQSEVLGKAIRLAEALGQRAERTDAPQVDVRTFAQDACGDTKALRDYAPAVIAILRRLRPDLFVESDLEPADLLATWGVVAMPHPLLVSGALTLDGHALPWLDFYGVPPEESGRLAPRSTPAYVLTIENQASFVRHAREVNGSGGGLVLYTGGFPSRAILRAIVDLCRRAKAPVFHWGDLDAGGVRIFLHLEAALADCSVVLTPHLMEAERVRASGRDLGRGRGVSVPPGSAVCDLGPLVGGPGFLSLEQEALAPQAPRLF